MTLANQPIVIGTAGHIDHGKTSLVRALTGIDTDRLKVEKERGITTELGFAHLDLGERRFGVVDVPGHERFLRAMVAGAAGLDLVCMVVAADEGLMPQSREHLDVCQLLGVRRGLVALTKRDLVDADWLALISAEIREGLAGSFLADAAMIPLSARTGDGLDALRAELVRLAADLPSRDATGSFRLPLDRVFTIKGFGTVVTGTIMGGTVRVGDEVVLHPRDLPAKVRGLEVHGAAVDEARAGMRCAVNLTGVGREQVERGDLLAHPGTAAPSHLIDARFRYLATSRGPLGRRSRVLLHHATAQVMATIVLLDRDALEPGGEALVQLHLDASAPIAALPGDRFIARGFVVQEHHGTTIGGGEIIRVQAPKRRRSSIDASATALAMEQADRDRRIALEVRTAAAAAIDRAGLVRRLGTGSEALAAALARLVESGELVAAGNGDSTVYCHAEPFAALEAQALAALDAHGGDGAIGREELRARLPRATPVRLFELALDSLVRRGAIELELDQVRRARRRAAVAPPPSPLDARVLEAFGRWALTPPRPTEIAGELREPPAEVAKSMTRLVASGALVKVKPDYVAAAGALAELRTRLVAHLEARGQITPAEWKDLCGTTRKFSIPLAEHFDAEKLTLRVGEIRKRRG